MPKLKVDLILQLPNLLILKEKVEDVSSILYYTSEDMSDIILKGYCSCFPYYVLNTQEPTDENIMAQIPLNNIKLIRVSN